MSKVFVSYARSTERQARELADALRALGYDVWRDDELPAHRPYAQVIEERLKAADAVLVIWSDDARQSEWVRAEADLARKAGTLVQLSLDGVTPPLPFNQLQCAKLDGWTGDLAAPAWRRIVESLADVTGQPRPVRPAASTAPALSPPDPELPARPSIAVLPFTHLGAEAGEDYFADGMREEITNALTHFPSLFVIASGSVHGYPPGQRDFKAIGRELGVRYLLEGSVQKAGGRVRIAVKLVAAADGAQIWTRRFDDALDDVFALQDEVARRVAGALDSTLETAEIQRARSRPAARPDAYDLYLRALPLTRAWDQESAPRALELLEAAVALDPDYASALMLAAFARSQLLLSGWAEDPADCHRRGLEDCRRALRLAPQDPLVLSLAVSALLVLGDDAAECERLAERALQINPGSAGNLLGSGWAHAVHGDPALAIERIDASLRLDPRSPLRPFHLTGQGIALFALRRFDEAAALLGEIVRALPEYPVARIFLAASLAHAGRLDDARTALAPAQASAESALSILREPVRRDLLAEGLALAGRGG
jgi:adenylate cyclase